MEKIIFLFLCLLNTASKVVMYTKSEMEEEEKLRKLFLNYAVNNNIQIYQLPCPEFTLYGSQRWGHVSDQFDNPFFRKHCQELLEPVIRELTEYINHPESFEVLGIVGIDGSPSCGVKFTCSGQWYGSFEERENLKETIDSCHSVNRSGILIDEFQKMLVKNNLDGKVKITSLSEITKKISNEMNDND